MDDYVNESVHALVLVMVLVSELQDCRLDHDHDCSGDGFFREKEGSDTDEVQRGAWGSVRSKAQSCGFLSSVWPVWERQRAGSPRVCSPRVQFYACRLPSVELQRARPTTERAFNSTVLLLGSPHALQTKGSQ